MPRNLAIPVIACSLLFVAAPVAQANPIQFIGFDLGASSLATMPNSQAAAASFDAAAALLGPVNLIDFESVALGPISNTNLGGGVTLNANSQAGASISNASTNCQFGFALCGGNTTLGGQNFAELYGGSLTFSFATPIQAFGAYLTGIQGEFVGQQTIVYTSGQTQTINIPMLPGFVGGGAFVGFTDAGASINSITINFLGDIVGTDDVRYGPRSTVPDAGGTLMLMGLGVMGLRMWRRR
jgi:hypothetical protein